MFKKFCLLILAFLVFSSVHWNIKSSIIEISPIVENLMRTEGANFVGPLTVPSKNKLFSDAYLLYPASPSHLITDIPKIEPFQNNLFSLQNSAYRSYFNQPFHLII